MQYQYYWQKEWCNDKIELDDDQQKLVHLFSYFHYIGTMTFNELEDDEKEWFNKYRKNWPSIGIADKSMYNPNIHFYIDKLPQCCLLFCREDMTYELFLLNLANLNIISDKMFENFMSRYKKIMEK
jgi:hypothetical protein